MAKKYPPLSFEVLGVEKICPAILVEEI